MSDARWRQIASGYQTISGTKVPVHAPAETLARMARTVGVTPAQLAEAGRTDAAEELQSRLEAEPVGGGDVGPAGDAQVEAIAALLATLPPEAQDEVVRRVQQQASQGRLPAEHDSQLRRNIS